MKLEFDSIQGGLNVTNTPNCKILRHIYKWDCYGRRCLLRIYEFKTKTVVITSQLNGAVIWEKDLIFRVVIDFDLDTNLTVRSFFLELEEIAINE